MTIARSDVKRYIAVRIERTAGGRLKHVRVGRVDDVSQADMFRAELLRCGQPDLCRHIRLLTNSTSLPRTTISGYRHGSQQLLFRKR